MRACAAVTAASALARPALGQAPAGPSTPLVIGMVPAPPVIPALYARSQNMFARAGINADLQAMQNTASIIAAEIGGSVQVGYGDTFSLVQAFQKNIPLKLVSPSGLYSSSHATIKIVVAPDSPIKSGKDLSGKTVGVTTLKDITGFSVIAWLDRDGADWKSVHFFESPPNLLGQAVLSHRVDASVIFEPFLSAAEAAGARSIGSPFDAISSSFMPAAWFSVAPWVTEHRDVAKTFAAVMARSAAYVNGHQKETLPLLADFSKIPIEVLATLYRSQIPPAIVASTVQPVIDSMAKFGQIPSSFKAEEMMLENA